jgi:AmmeMemoRadiSam system protein A
MPSPEAGAGEPPTGGESASAEPNGVGLDSNSRARLLAIARGSIAHGLAPGGPLPVDPEGQPPALRAPRASFVTLHRDGNLRGCIGHLEPVAPLARDVADNAHAAAFRDPRFSPLRAEELAQVHIEISVLTPPEPIDCDGEQALLAALVPGRDGVILAEGGCRGTFLPAVWEQLPRPELFLRSLKQKAGLAPDHWSDQLQAWRYRTESFGE